MNKKLYLPVSVVLVVLSATPALAFTNVTSSANSVTISRGVVLGDNEEVKTEQQKPEDNKQEDQKTEVRKPEDKLQESKVEVKREDVQVTVESGEKPSVDVRKKNKYDEALKKALEQKRENLKNQLERLNESGTITEKQRESLKTAIEAEHKKIDSLVSTSVEKVEDDKIKLDINGSSIETTKDGTTIKDGTDEVDTELPISLENNSPEMTVTLPNGDDKKIKTPKEIVDGLASGKVIDALDVSTESTESSKLEMSDGKLVYNLNGSLSEKLFGIIPVKIPKTVQVDTTGSVISTNQSLMSRILDFLSL